MAVLHFVDGLTLEQVAHECGFSVSGVRKRLRALRATGRAFLSSTSLRGRVAIRFCFINWRTTTADVEEVVRLLHTLGAEVSRSFI